MRPDLLCVLERWGFGPSSTVGSLYVPGLRHCYILEDQVRDGLKVPGETAISYGEYSLVRHQSSRFGREMVRLEDVPGFTGILLHPGNTHEDTEGCLLTGEEAIINGEDFEVRRSRDAYDRVVESIRQWLKDGRTVSIQIRRRG